LSWHHRQAGFGQAALQRRRTLLMMLAFDLALFQVAYRGERGRRREDEPGAWLILIRRHLTSII